MKILFTKRQWKILLGSISNPWGLLKYLYLKVAYGLKLKKLLTNPVDVDIEPINRCNFSCSHCQVPTWNKPLSKLDVAQFQEIIVQFPHLLKVKLQGMGEPLLNKELMTLLGIGEKQNITMSFTTNGSLLEASKIKELVQLDKTYINFSIDGASAETFEGMRNGSDFTQVCQNIKAFTNALDSNSESPRFQAWMLVTQKNINDIPNVVKLIKELKLKHLNLQMFFSDWGKEALQENAKSYRIQLNSAEFKEVLAEARAIAKELKIELNVHYGDYYTTKNKCPMPWLSTYIAANGDVVPCSILADSDVIKMGNVFDRDFSHIWNSPQYQEFREKHRKLEIPDCCRQCYLDLD